MAWDKPFGISFPLLGSIFIYLSFIFSVYSACLYTAGLIQKIKAARIQKKSSSH